MIWILMIILSIIFFKAGILYTLFTITMVALKASLALILALFGLLTWRWWSGRKKYSQWRKL
ncbi:MAG: hypothetical protein ACYDHC_02885 [Desulfuromonadaceae bacterium]